MSEKLQRLPQGWEEMLRDDAEALGPPDGAKRRVRKHLEATLGVVAFTAATAVGVGSSATAATTATATGAAVAAGVKIVVAVALVSVASGTAYVGLKVRAERAHRASAPAATLQRPALPTIEPPKIEAPPKVETPELAATPDPLIEEEDLLNGARRALARGALDEASRMLQLYRTRFDHGRLSEESEALEIRLLLRGGRMGEARRRAAQFRAAHPRSLQLKIIDEALRGPR